MAAISLSQNSLLPFNMQSIVRMMMDNRDDLIKVA